MSKEGHVDFHVPSPNLTRASPYGGVEWVVSVIGNERGSAMKDGRM